MLRGFIDKTVIPFVSSGKLLDFESGPEPVLVQLLNRDYNFEIDHYDLHYSPKKYTLTRNIML